LKYFSQKHGKNQHFISNVPNKQIHKSVPITINETVHNTVYKIVHETI